MSKYNNVNPDHYKVAGRERPGKGIVKSERTPVRPTRNPEQERFRQRQRGKKPARQKE